MWQLLKKKSGSSSLRFRSTSGSSIPTACAPSMQLSTPSSLHARVSRSNGMRTPGCDATVSKTATRGLFPSAFTARIVFVNWSTRYASLTG